MHLTFLFPWINISEFLHFSLNHRNSSSVILIYVQSSRKVLITKLCYTFEWISPECDKKNPAKYWFLIKFAPGLQSAKVCIVLNQLFKRHFFSFFSGFELTF